MDFGKYQLEGMLGQGGMGQVFLARDKVLGRQVALKVLSKEIQSDPVVVQRFLKEAQLSAGLSHPNIVVLHDFGTELGCTYIAMEYLRGDNLKTYIEKKVPLLWSHKLDLAIQIAKGLEHAHQKNIVHRDIKPSNIQILPNGEVKLLDFGIAKVASTDRTQLTETGVIIGTPGYASPEQVRGFPPVTPASDVFSFGIVLYELLVYRRAFSAGDTMSLLFKIVYDEPPEMALDLSEVGSGLRELVAQCLRKDPEQRAPNMSPVLHRLRQIQKRLLAQESKHDESHPDMERPWLPGASEPQPLPPEFALSLQAPAAPASAAYPPQPPTMTLQRPPAGVAPSQLVSTTLLNRTSALAQPNPLFAPPDATLAPPAQPKPDLSEWERAMSAPAPQVEAPVSQPPLAPLSPIIGLDNKPAKPARPPGSILDSNLQGIRNTGSSSILELERRISGEVQRKEFSVLNEEVRRLAGPIDKMFNVGSAVEWIRADASGKKLFHAKVTARAGVTTIRIEENLEHVASSLMLGWLFGLGGLGGAACIAVGVFVRAYLIPAFGAALCLILASVLLAKRAFDSRSRQRVQELRRLLERLSNHISRTMPQPDSK